MKYRHSNFQLNKISNESFHWLKTWKRKVVRTETKMFVVVVVVVVVVTVVVDGDGVVVICDGGVGIVDAVVINTDEQEILHLSYKLTVTENIISELSLASMSKRVFVRNHSYENIFYLHIHFHVNQTHVHLIKFCAKTSFERETKDNSEMAHSLFK